MKTEYISAADTAKLIKPARAKQPGRRPTNEKFVRFEPDTFALLVELFERSQPESMNAIVNKAVREYCARELGAKEGTG